MANKPGQALPRYRSHRDRGHRKKLAALSQFNGTESCGESLNYGTEQEHLNNVAGARLRITGLGTANGPGIEFLEYLAPRTGTARLLIAWPTISGIGRRSSGQQTRQKRRTSCDERGTGRTFGLGQKVSSARPGRPCYSADREIGCAGSRTGRDPCALLMGIMPHLLAA